MLTLASGRRIVPTKHSIELRRFSNQALARLRNDLYFWNLFQIHWLHAQVPYRLGPDLGGWALEGYPPCNLQEAASNLMAYAGYRFALLDITTRLRLPLTEGLLRFVDRPLRILPAGQPGLFLESDFQDFPALSRTNKLSPRETYAFFERVIEDQ